jgi:hypothetical protein
MQLIDMSNESNITKNVLVKNLTRHIMRVSLSGESMLKDKDRTAVIFNDDPTDRTDHLGQVLDALGWSDINNDRADTAARFVRGSTGALIVLLGKQTLGKKAKHNLEPAVRLWEIAGRFGVSRAMIADTDEYPKRFSNESCEVPRFVHDRFVIKPRHDIVIPQLSTEALKPMVDWLSCQTLAATTLIAEHQPSPEIVTPALAEARAA